MKVALGCGYLNAGTVEMLYQDGDFWFLEMNTRLQVEHCVTEMVTQLDLVAEQLRVADGEPLSFTQDSVVRRGHSIECRINAENPATGFMPSPGTITRMRVPAGPGVRWDGGYDEGDNISQYYDNLIGKLVVWAPDRDTQPGPAGVRALHELEITGVHTTIPAHIALLAAPRLRGGQPLDEVGRGGARRVAVLRRPPRRAGDRHRTVAGDAARGARRAHRPGRGQRQAVLREALASGDDRGGGPGRPPGRPARSRPRSAGAVARATARSAHRCRGRSSRCSSTPGDTVEAGQAVLVLEAMKMENHINAEQAGTVAEIRVAAGDTVGTGDVLVVIE